MTPAGSAWNGLTRSSFGAKRRASYQAEKAYSRAFEETLALHRLDWWHCTVAQRSQPGWPDYAVFGDGWLGFVELKARNPISGRAGKVDAGQRRYQASIEAAGGEWRTFLLPDHWQALDEWLNGHTGRNIGSRIASFGTGMLGG